MSQSDHTELLSQVRNRDRQALAKAITIIENSGQPFEIEDKAGAQVIGITGAPGVGKSTTVDALIKLLRERNFSVAVLAVDPSSPISGGALLGDRIRLTDHFTDPGVFIRSLATRGHLGGLSVSTKAVLKLVQSAKFDFIIVETVGVGQSEVEVMRVVDTVVVVLAPGMGDGIQASKRLQQISSVRFQCRCLKQLQESLGFHQYCLVQCRTELG
jgi:LAO/AO transport system kinase